MAHSTFDHVIQLKKMLNNLDTWIESATQFAKTKSFDADVLLAMRLAPDQYPLVRQIQTSCDSAKLCAARLAGREAPVHEDKETTIDALRSRIREVVAYLEGFQASDFDGARERMIKLSFLPGQGLTGADYLAEFAMPNFYFHVTTAYAILRHAGVDLGKQQFIGSLNLKPL